MIMEILAAARAVPRIADALEKLGDLGQEMAAQKRKDDKDTLVEATIIAAKSKRKRVRDKEISGVGGNNPDSPEGV
jgi:cytochrome P450